MNDDNNINGNEKYVQRNQDDEEVFQVQKKKKMEIRKKNNMRIKDKQKISNNSRKISLQKSEKATIENLKNQVLESLYPGIKIPINSIDMANQPEGSSVKAHSFPFSFLPTFTNSTPALNLYQLLVYFGIPVVKGRVEIVEITPDRLHTITTDGVTEDGKKRRKLHQEDASFRYFDSDNSDVEEDLGNSVLFPKTPTSISDELIKMTNVVSLSDSDTTTGNITSQVFMSSHNANVVSISPTTSNLSMIPSTNILSYSSINTPTVLHNFHSLPPSYPICYSFMSSTSAVSQAFLGSTLKKFCENPTTKITKLPPPSFFQTDLFVVTPFSSIFQPKEKSLSPKPPENNLTHSSLKSLSTTPLGFSMPALIPPISSSSLVLPEPLSAYPPLILNPNNSKHIHTLNLLKVFYLSVCIMFVRVFFLEYP
jgi:hypothetical protein